MYDREYFEYGVETGKSNYQNYRWIPELTIPMAMTIIDLLGIKPNESVLDYGCAKGYLVKALRMLHRNAWGQISATMHYQKQKKIQSLTCLNRMKC